MLYRRTLLFIHSIYNSSHLLIPNFQSTPSLIPHLPRKASVPLIQISGCSTVASIPMPLPPPSLPPGTYCYSYWAHASWVPLCVCVCVFVWVTQSCLTLRDSVDCSPSGSSINGILQGRILEWVAIPVSRGSSQPRDQTQVSWIAGRLFTVWAAREALLWLDGIGGKGLRLCNYSFFFSHDLKKDSLSSL